MNQTETSAEILSVCAANLYIKYCSVSAYTDILKISSISQSETYCSTTQVTFDSLQCKQD